VRKRILARGEERTREQGGAGATQRELVQLRPKGGIMSATSTADPAGEPDRRVERERRGCYATRGHLTARELDRRRVEGTRGQRKPERSVLLYESGEADGWMRACGCVCIGRAVATWEAGGVLFVSIFLTLFSSFSIALCSPGSGQQTHPAQFCSSPTSEFPCQESFQNSLIQSMPRFSAFDCMCALRLRQNEARGSG